MRGPHNIWRLIRTGATLQRAGALDKLLEAMDAPPIVRASSKVISWPFQWLGYKGDPNLPPISRALTALGPAYIKFGQVLSTRPDLVGADLAQELRVLQDQLPPFPQEQAIAAIESELEQPLEEIFSEFSKPVAAASIAQVHQAIVQESGQRVAVKVLRPGIEKAFYKDIDAFYFAAGMIEFLSRSSRRLKPKDVVAHFESVVRGELDLRTEAAAASEFATTTADDAGFAVPTVLWRWSARRVMTMDWVDGISMGDRDLLIANGVNVAEVAERVLQLFLSHALRDGYFHADMHQGNLKIDSANNIVAYDFGIMGRIDEYTRRVYAEILYGFIRRDYRRVAEVHFEAGYVPADQDVDAFALALRAVGEPVFGMDASHISMGRLLAHLFEVTERFGMETRTELILLQRTMVVVEGVARSLDGDINIWATARPVVETYIRENMGPKAAMRDLRRTALVLSRYGPELPMLADAVMRRQLQKDAKAEENTAKPWAYALGGAGVMGAIWALSLYL